MTFREYRTKYGEIEHVLIQMTDEQEKETAMKDIFYHELRNRVQEIREIEKDEMSGELYHIFEKGMMLIDTIHLLEEFSNAARKYGFLELEERACKAESTPGGRYLKQFICLVVDGIDPELLEEMAELRYYTAPVSSYSALQCLIMVKWILEIQRGPNPRVIREIVFKNLSARLAVMVAEDMEMMGPVRLSDVGDVCNKLLTIFLKLIETCEIVCDEELITKEMAGIFVKRFEKGNEMEIKSLKAGFKICGVSIISIPTGGSGRNKEFCNDPVYE